MLRGSRRSNQAAPLACPLGALSHGRYLQN
nr:MAG TPA: hypothetical protein [Caudoviricetes sp.]